MTRKIRVGVIGTSWFTETFHLPALASHPDAEITAICGRSRERAGAVAGKFGSPRVFTDYHELIERGGVDAVVVAAPDDLHYPMAMAVLEAGKHLLSEKPVALQAGQAKALYEKALAAGVMHLVMFTFRGHPSGFRRSAHRPVTNHRCRTAWLRGLPLGDAALAERRAGFRRPGAGPAGARPACAGPPLVWRSPGCKLHGPIRRFAAESFDRRPPVYRLDINRYPSAA